MKLTKLLENEINQRLDLMEAPEGADILKKSKGLTKMYNTLPANKKNKFIEFLQTMPANLFLEFRKTCDGLTAGEISTFAKKFKSVKSVENLNNQSYKGYQKLWDTYVGQAIGKGELYISFLVNNAIVQGSTESFDIGDGNNHYEVKSLDILDAKSGKFKAGNIRPGAEGKVSRYPFTKQLMDLFTICSALKNPEIKSGVLMLGDTKALQKIVDIYESIPTEKGEGASLTQTPGDIPKGILTKVYDAILKLNKIKNLPLGKNVTTSRISVKGSGADSAYWIAPDDVDDIVAAAGKDKEATIKVGAPITDESKDAKILLVDLFNHPFIKSPKSFTQGLGQIKLAFFGGKAGLIYFSNGVTYVSADMSEFATIESSQDGYRFGLKSKYNSYPYIQDQP